MCSKWEWQRVNHWVNILAHKRIEKVDVAKVTFTSTLSMHAGILKSFKPLSDKAQERVCGVINFPAIYFSE